MIKILFENENYKITKFTNTTNSNITSVCFDHWRKMFDANTPQDYKQPFAKDVINQLGFNYISVQTRRNDWYQMNGILDGMQAIANTKIKDEIIIGYGGSMGGHAAISFSKLANFDYFIALAPQASLASDFMDSINDRRWKTERIHFQHDFILSGDCRESKGIIIYDPTHSLDNKHANEIVKNTKCKTLHCVGSGHFPGKAINEKFGLKKLYRAINRFYHNDKKIDRLLADVQECVKISSLD